MSTRAVRKLNTRVGLAVIKAVLLAESYPCRVECELGADEGVKSQIACADSFQEAQVQSLARVPQEV